jgi:3-phytase
MKRFILFLVPLGLLLSAIFVPEAPLPASVDDVVLVTAEVETEPVPINGDAADDPAIWIHPTNTELSAIIGTDKTNQGGLVVYNLDGSVHQRVNIGVINNVDLRYNFPLNDQPITIVAATNRADSSLVLYRMNPETRELENVAAREITSGVNEAYGFCMYVSPFSGRYYAFVNSTETGDIEQWELFDNGSGRVDAELVRAFTVGTQTEGCVADDEFGFLYVGEEGAAIWKYNAEPDAGDERVAVDTSGNDGNLVPDIEGLALYYASDGTGYLIASSQGSNDFAVYQREEDNDYLGRFAIESASVDGVTVTDGIGVTNFPLGSAFPHGVFVAQDHNNTHPEANQNFKLVSWDDIAGELDLMIDTEFDPRAIGGE